MQARPAPWRFSFALLPLCFAVAVVAFAAACSNGDGAEKTPTPPAATSTGTAVATPSPSPPTASPAATSTPRPTATPSPTPTKAPPSPTPTPTTAPVGVLFEHGDRASNKVALTFDMGGRVEPALDIMNWLIANGVPATIFMTGAMAENPNTDAGRDVLRLVEANPALFVLGNHSYSHPDFRDLTPAAMSQELLRTETAISALVSLSPRPWFRPPFGGVNAAVVASVAAAGYPRTIMWDVDTADWNPEADGGPTADEIVAKVAAKVQGGSIVLMHLGGYNTFEALPGILAALAAKGLQPVTLAALLP